MVAKQHTSDEFGKDQHVAGTPVGLGLGAEGTWATRGADDETQVTDSQGRIPGQVGPLKFVLAMAAVALLGVGLYWLYLLLSQGAIARIM